ncbi:hypothetical protein LEP1GSC199_0497 [Leptospira vanthielii serovar Holland str. Waz Holland = ATCC 700522]|uniref:Uncharacterized protein n=1 Tax=Leptospira vanthielii serovar Holland str. Waz Holland = ATCC 700522 TaxID=1218591 RepID=N1W2B9_9LEPT|nr:hypothetical protein LEP1GSC199_0497 [Leptospira vanthielii serovar Holland str. Waz Holland = ATCC 700522]
MVCAMNLDLGLFFQTPMNQISSAQRKDGDFFRSRIRDSSGSFIFAQKSLEPISYKWI